MMMIMKIPILMIPILTINNDDDVSAYMSRCRGQFVQISTDDHDYFDDSDDSDSNSSDIDDFVE